MAMLVVKTSGICIASGETIVEVALISILHLHLLQTQLIFSCVLRRRHAQSPSSAASESASRLV